MNMQWLNSPANKANPVDFSLEDLCYWADRKYLQGEQTQRLMQLAVTEEQRRLVAVVALCQLTDRQLEPLLSQLDSDTQRLLEYRNYVRGRYDLKL